MRPVNRTAFFIPDVFTVEAHPIALRKRVDAWRDVDVVRDEHRLTRRELNDESLMPAAIKVVRQDTSDYSFALDLNVARPFGKRTTELIILRRGSNDAPAACGDQRTDDERDNEDTFHSESTLLTWKVTRCRYHEVQRADEAKPLYRPQSPKTR